MYYTSIPQTHAPHVRIPVMLFQFKECGEVDGRKFCFKLQARM